MSENFTSRLRFLLVEHLYILGWCFLTFKKFFEFRMKSLFDCLLRKSTWWDNLYYIFQAIAQSWSTDFIFAMIPAGNLIETCFSSVACSFIFVLCQHIAIQLQFINPTAILVVSIRAIFHFITYLSRQFTSVLHNSVHQFYQNQTVWYGSTLWIRKLPGYRWINCFVWAV